MEKQANTNKRRRISSSSEECRDNRKSWNDSSTISPTLLKEMGLSILSDQESSEDENEIFSDEKSDTENTTVYTEVKHISKKQKLSPRQPLKYLSSDSLICNETVSYLDNRLNTDHVGKHDGSKNTITSLKSLKTKENITNSVQNDLIVKRTAHSPSRGEDCLSRLPEEVLLYIMKLLDRQSIVNCANVCKLLRRVAYDESLWYRLDLSDRFLPPGALGHLLSRRTCILRLALTSFSEPIFHPNQLPSNFTSNLQYLDLSMATVTAESLASIIGACTRLKKLSLEHCPVNDDVCFALAENAGLEVLNLTMCQGITPNGLRLVLTSCKRLVALNIGWTGLNAAAVDVVVEEVTDHIERLNMSGCRKSLFDRHVIKILSRCSKLLELDISDCICVTSDVLKYIIESDLEHLALSRCYNIELESLNCLTKASNLEYLEAFGLAREEEFKRLEALSAKVNINQFPFSCVARPTVGLRRTSIWGVRVRD